MVPLFKRKYYRDVRELHICATNEALAREANLLSTHREVMRSLTSLGYDHDL